MRKQNVTGDVPDSRGRPPPLVWIATAWSALVALVGVWWLLAPGDYALTGPGSGAPDASLVALVDSRIVSGSLVVLGAVGVLLLVIGSSRGTRDPARWVIAPALVYALIFGFLVPDMDLLVSAGYGAVLVGLPTLAVFVLLLALRHKVFRWIALAALLAGAALVVTFDVDVSILTRTAGEIGDRLPGFLREQGPGLVAFGGGLVWVGVALRAAGVRLGVQTPAPYRPPLRDWGWWVTIGAIAAPLLFAVQRMSWLTPWPIGLEAQELEAEPGVRLFGLFLAVAAVGGAVLTMGLISRWGAVYPSWFPVVGGKQVAPAWPSVLAATIGLVVAVAGRSVGQQVLLADDPVHPLLQGMAIDFMLWGPLLVAAAVAYFRRRTGLSRSSETSHGPGTSEGSRAALN